MLESFPSYHHPDLILGFDHTDDCGVMRISEDKAVIFTVDFFPAIADDPRVFGKVAAANALSDIYAMGGTPLCALNIVSFPEGKLPLEVLEEVLLGGAEKIAEAGAIVVGGHTMKDSELKYGLSVTGTIHPDRIVYNSGARPGDALVLTKPLGTGIYSTALKNGALSGELEQDMYRVMSALNRDASEVMNVLGANACTDITGYGLVGHALEIAEESGVSLIIDFDSIPFLPAARELAEKGFLTGGGMATLKASEDRIKSNIELAGVEMMLLSDPQTSGGLLVSIERERSGKYLDMLRDRGNSEAAVIGEVAESAEAPILLRQE